MTTFLIVLIVIYVYLMIKNIFTLRNSNIIIEAIRKYQIDMIMLGEYNVYAVDYDDMEPYIKTLLRYYDFGYTNILPVEKYEIIKPYIKS